MTGKIKTISVLQTNLKNTDDFMIVKLHDIVVKHYKLMLTTVIWMVENSEPIVYLRPT